MLDILNQYLKQLEEQKQRVIGDHRAVEGAIEIVNKLIKEAEKLEDVKELSKCTGE